jgi:hypothetical protein
MKMKRTRRRPAPRAAAFDADDVICTFIIHVPPSSNACSRYEQAQDVRLLPRSRRPSHFSRLAKDGLVR